MIYLLLVSFIWAFSFGLIKGKLSGIDSNFVSFIRMLISLFVFLPFIHVKRIKKSILLKLFFIGMIQYGLMYIAYIYSFKHLAAHQVAIFTIFTPLFVTLINDIYSRKFHKYFFISVIVAILGTFIISYDNKTGTLYWQGFAALQLSNLCFAFGQIAYRKIMLENKEIKDLSIFAVLYFGAVVLTAAATAFKSDLTKLSLTPEQLLSLLYLGILASGICFFLWNYGAKKVNPGTLAIMNNMKIPLAVACSLLIFGESKTADINNLIIGGIIIILAVILNEIIIKRQNSRNPDK